MGIRAITADDHAAWTSLWTGYLTFYETELPQRVFDETWRRLLDPNEPVWGAFAVDDTGAPIGLVHWLFHRTCWAIENAATCRISTSRPSCAAAGMAGR